MKVKITALEISKNLPMVVKCLNECGMFKDQAIKFHELSHKSGRPRLLGEVVGIKGRVMCVLELSKEFEIIEPVEPKEKMKMKVTIRLKSVEQLIDDGYEFARSGTLMKDDENRVTCLKIEPRHLHLLGGELACEINQKGRHYHENSETTWPRSQIAEVFQVFPTEPEKYNLKKDFNVYLSSSGGLCFALKVSNTDKLYKESSDFIKIELE